MTGENSGIISLHKLPSLCDFQLDLKGHSRVYKRVIISNFLRTRAPYRFRISLLPNMTDNPLRILSLDGGGVRGISSLYILKELMRQLRSQGLDRARQTGPTILQDCQASVGLGPIFERNYSSGPDRLGPTWTGRSLIDIPGVSVIMLTGLFINPAVACPMSLPQFLFNPAATHKLGFLWNISTLHSFEVSGFPTWRTVIGSVD